MVVGSTIGRRGVLITGHGFLLLVLIGLVISQQASIPGAATKRGMINAPHTAVLRDIQ